MSTINKPLPHRPFSIHEKAPRRQHQPQMTSVSNPRLYAQAHVKPTVSPVPKRAHLVTRSPSPPYYHHAATSDALPSSRAKPSHSFSESISRSQQPLSSTSDLVPPHLKQTRSSSFWRRHWNRITRLCHNVDSHQKRYRQQDCAWGTPAFTRAY